MGILTASFSDCWLGEIGWGRRNGCRFSRHFSSDLLGNPPDLGVVTVDGGLNGIPQIAKKMRLIGDLHSVRSALADTVGVGSSTIARDNLDTRMPAQPLGQHRGLPIRKQVDDAIALQINQDGSIPMAASKRPVVNGPAPSASQPCPRQSRLKPPSAIRYPR